jgi:hypothetical protein
MDESAREDVRELTAAAEHRRELDRELTMSERLAALHELCIQLAPMKLAAGRAQDAADLENLPDA